MYQPISTTEPMLDKNPAYGTDKMRSTIQPMRLEKPDVPQCNDRFFAMLFLLNVLSVSTFALWKGVPAVKHVVPDQSHHISNYNHLFMLFSMVSLGALVIAVVWMKLLLSYAEHLIKIALWMNVGLLLGMALTTMVVNPFLPFFFILMAGVNVCYIYAVRNRIAFASANLKCACAAISKNKHLISVAIALVIVQFIWIVLWTLGAFGIYQSFRESDANCAEEEKRGEICGGAPASVALFFLLVGLYWGQQVVQNLLTCTTAGAVASWWYQENAQNSVSGALYRALTTSFGSICFGSLIVAVLQALQTVARSLREKAQEDNNAGLACLACMAECILNCLEGIMEYINKWAFCYVGIYGYDFKTSGKAVMELFKSRGWTAVINDDLTSSAMGLSAFGVSLVCCGAGLLVAKFVPLSWLEPLTGDAMRYGSFGAFSFIVGLSMALILITVVTTALHTIFVCFAEDPIAFGRTHPEHYSELVEAWRQFHPDAWVVAYGDHV